MNNLKKILEEYDIKLNSFKALGKVTIFDTNKGSWSTLTCFGKYETRRECQMRIDWYRVDGC